MSHSPLSIPLHQSLLEPVTLGGISRTPAIWILVIAGVLVLAMHKVGGILIGYALWVLCRQITKMDPFFFEVIVRQMRSRTSFLGN